MCKLRVHSAYDHWYIPLNSKQGKFQPQTIFWGDNKTLSDLTQPFNPVGL